MILLVYIAHTHTCTHTHTANIGSVTYNYFEHRIFCAMALRIPSVVGVQFGSAACTYKALVPDFRSRYIVHAVLKAGHHPIILCLYCLDGVFILLVS